MKRQEDGAALTVEQASAAISACLVPIKDSKSTPIRAALGRVLAHDISSPIDVPAHDNSAMDGYALLGSALAAESPVSFTLVGTALAGKPFAGRAQAGECVHITTGAILPDGCDSVVPYELMLEQSADNVVLPARAVASGANVRHAGEDLRKGSIALGKAKVLRPADIGLLASLGMAEVPLLRRLRVAFFSTGDELRSLGETLAPGCVYDSNRHVLHAMLTRLGCEVIDMGVVKDDPAALEAALRAACAQADAIVTSGGVSAGTADYLRPTMAKLGTVNFWKIAMRPGRPMAFGRITSEGKDAWLFGLPGNPVAVMVSFYMIARDALLQLAGAQHSPLPRVRVPSAVAIRKRPGRTEYQRGILHPDADGQLTVSLTGEQGSGILRSMSEANCMLVLPHERGDVSIGEPVEVILFDGLI